MIKFYTIIFVIIIFFSLGISILLYADEKNGSTKIKYYIAGIIFFFLAILLSIITFLIYIGII